MKIKKIALLTAMGALSLGAIGLSVVATQTNLFDDLVNASQKENDCVLEFSNKNAVTFDDLGNGESVSSTLKLFYKNAASGGAEDHVVLHDGGEMYTNGDKYDPVLNIGSVTNGLTTIKVFFTVSDGATLKLSTSRDGTFAEYQELTSGAAVSFNQHGLPKLFKLVAAGGDVHIQSVQISCTTIEDFIVNVNGQEDMQLDWYYIIENQFSYERGEKIANINQATFKDGDLIGFNVTPGTPVHVLWGDFEVKNTSIRRENIGSDDFETFLFEITHKDVDVTFTRLRGQNLYEGSDFVGTWNVFSVKDDSAHNLELTSDGYLKFDDSKTYFQFDENDGRFTFDKLNNSDVSFRFSDDVCVLKIGYTDYYVGVKGAFGTVTLNGIAGSSSNFVAQLVKDGKTINTFADSEFIVLEGGEEQISFAYNNSNFKDATLLTMKAIPSDGTNSVLNEISSYYTIKEEIDGVMTHTLYAQISDTSLSFKKQGDEKGTFTGENGDLILDGFGTYTLGDTSGTYTYDKNTKVVTLTDTESNQSKVLLDLDAKTYEVFVPIENDPWTDKAYTYIGSEFDLTFDNGTVTINPKDGVYWWSDTASYSVASNIVEFKLEDYSNTYTFKFFIDSSLEEITLTSFSSNGWGGEVSYSKGMVLTLEK